MTSTTFQPPLPRSTRGEEAPGCYLRRLGGVHGSKMAVLLTGPPYRLAARPRAVKVGLIWPPQHFNHRSRGQRAVRRPLALHNYFCALSCQPPAQPTRPSAAPCGSHRPNVGGPSAPAGSSGPTRPARRAFNAPTGRLPLWSYYLRRLGGVHRSKMAVLLTGPPYRLAARPRAVKVGLIWPPQHFNHRSRGQRAVRRPLALHNYFCTLSHRVENGRFPHRAALQAGRTSSCREGGPDMTFTTFQPLLPRSARGVRAPGPP
jgi:hypothetical protein